MRYLLMVAALIFLGMTTYAQTRRIAHRFHSGEEHVRYDGGDGSYGEFYIPEMVSVHLESGRDTLVPAWDSLANPNYQFYVDSTPRAMFYPKLGKKEDIRDMGGVTHKLTAR